MIQQQQQNTQNITSFNHNNNNNNSQTQSSSTTTTITTTAAVATISSQQSSTSNIPAHLNYNNQPNAIGYHHHTAGGGHHPQQGPQQQSSQPPPQSHHHHHHQQQQHSYQHGSQISNVPGPISSSSTSVSYHGHHGQQQQQSMGSNVNQSISSTATTISIQHSSTTSGGIQSSAAMEYGTTLSSATVNQYGPMSGKMSHTISNNNSPKFDDFDCPEKFGYYPDEKNCSKYHLCDHGKSRLKSCDDGLVFSTILKTCDWPFNVHCNLANGDRGDFVGRHLRLRNNAGTGDVDDNNNKIDQSLSNRRQPFGRPNTDLLAYLNDDNDYHDIHHEEFHHDFDIPRRPVSNNQNRLESHRSLDDETENNKRTTFSNDGQPWFQNVNFDQRRPTTTTTTTTSTSSQPIWFQQTTPPPTTAIQTTTQIESRPRHLGTSVRRKVIRKKVIPQITTTISTTSTTTPAPTFRSVADFWNNNDPWKSFRYEPVNRGQSNPTTLNPPTTIGPKHISSIRRTIPKFENRQRFERKPVLRDESEDANERINDDDDDDDYVVGRNFVYNIPEIVRNKNSSHRLHMDDDLLLPKNKVKDVSNNINSGGGVRFKPVNPRPVTPSTITTTTTTTSHGNRRNNNRNNNQNLNNVHYQ
ncbi:chitin binding [Dermatophagoides farinae]|uniref:Chitin binding n=1 Tax=Dermatophagoides farinae TaxID=6954 RepID=A0A922HS48_DERFA|nr:chitin binding [Dermatophagoides farinae]